MRHRYRYRIIKPLDWTKGGRLTVGEHGEPTIRGGEPVTFAVGDVWFFDADDLLDGAVACALEPADPHDVAAADVLEAARNALKQPPTVEASTALSDADRDHYLRGGEESFRKRGDFIGLVVSVLRRRKHGAREDPTRADLAAALDQLARLPKPLDLPDVELLLDYAVAVHVAGTTRQQRPGPKARRTTDLDLLVWWVYDLALAEAQEAYAADSRAPRDVKGVAKGATARRFGRSVSWVERIIAARPWHK